MNNIDNKAHEEHWNGSKNRAIRYYFYIQRGLTLLNEFRYLIMGILGAYYALRIENVLLIPAMFFLSLPILVLLGYISVHHVAKIIEYLNIQYSTHWSRYQITIQEDIRDELKKLNTKTK